MQNLFFIDCVPLSTTWEIFLHRCWLTYWQRGRLPLSVHVSGWHLFDWGDRYCMSNGLGGGIVSNCLKMSRMIRCIIRKTVINLHHIINYSLRVPFTMILVTGVIKLNTTLLEGRLDSTHKRPSCLLTGTRPSPRSVSVWRSVNRSDSL